MICPNLNDPEVKAKFDQLLSLVPEYAYYLWDKYEGEVPAKYYNLSNVLMDMPGLSTQVPSITPSVTTVEQKLEKFLSNFGFTTEQLDGLKEATGYSIIGATDFLEKTILVDKNKIELSYTKEAAYAIFNLLGRKNLLRKDLIASISLLPEYDSLKSIYINSKLADYQIRELVAIDYLRTKLFEAHKEALKTDNKAVSKDVTAKNSLEYTILKIKQWWSGIVRKYLKSYKLNQIENAFNQIANDVINDNTRLFNPSVTTTYKKLEVTGKQKEINDFLLSLGVINSGSLALNRQGTLTRQSLNDLDYFVPYYSKFGLFEKIAEKYPNIEYSEPYAGVMGNRSLTLSAKIGDVKIDFFLPTNLEESNKNKVVTIDGVKYHHWKNIFDAKIRIGSKKHLTDLAGFTPFTKEDGLLNTVGQRHYNFDFIQSKRSASYNQVSNEPITQSTGISIQTSPSLLYNYALAFFKDNGIAYSEKSLYLDLLSHFKGDTKKAIVAYYKTYSQNFKTFFGEIPSRNTINAVLFGSTVENQSKPSVLVDEQGEPIVFYHGAGTKFDNFSKDYFLSGEGAMAYGAGFYATNYKPTADNYRDTSKAAYETYKKLIKEENQELLSLIKDLKEDITEDSINSMLVGSTMVQFSLGRTSQARTRLLELLGVTETKALYIALTNPLQWRGEVSKENLAILQDEFNIKLESSTGGKVYREIQSKLGISDKEVSARMYQRGIDGVVHDAAGGMAVGGFSHKKGERHVIFFEPVQAKSVENSGLFSTNNENTYDPVESKPTVQQKSNGSMSNVMYSKATLDDIKNHYLRLEINLKLAQDLLKDPEYVSLDTYSKKIAYISNKVWQSETQKIKDRPSVTLIGNRIYHTSTEYVKPHQILGYADTTALKINSKYIINGGKKIAWARYDDSGVYVEIDPRYNFAADIVDLVETVEEEEIRAEIEMMGLQEALDAEKHALMEKLIQSNELLIDGEVLPLSNVMFQKTMELSNVLKRGNVRKFGQIFDKLVAKFPGVTWAWDTSIDGAARVDLATGQILVNPYLVKEDTAWHEFSHFIIRGLRTSNPEAFSKLVAEVEKLHAQNPTGSSQAYVEANYPELKGTAEFWEEVIATEVGSQATEYTPKTGLYNTIVQFFTDILTDLGFVTPKFDTLGDIVTALYNPNFEFEFYPTNSEVSDYMFSRVMPKDIDAFTEHLMRDPNNPDDFSPAIKQIQLISDAITDQEFARLMDTNKYFTSEEIRKSTSLRQAGAVFESSKGRIKAMATKEDVAEAVLDLANYMQYMSIYFQGLIDHLQTLSQDPNIPPGKKLGDIHRAFKQALVVQRHIEEITGDRFNNQGALARSVFKPNTVSSIVQLAQTSAKQEVNTNPFLKNLFWLKQSLNSIVEKHNQYIQEPILDELSEYYEEATKGLTESINQDIQQLDSQLSKKSFDVVGQANKNSADRTYRNRIVRAISKVGNGVDSKFVVTYTDGAVQEFTNFRQFKQSFELPISVGNILNRIQDSKDDYTNKLPTRENLSKLLMDTNSELFAAFDTATTTKNPGIQLVASYLKGMDISHRGSLTTLRSEMENLMQDIIAEEGAQFGGSIVDVRSFYKPYYRETFLYEVVDGVLNKDKRILVLNTATKTVEMRNYMTEQNYNIQHGMDDVADLDPTDMSAEAVARRSAAEQKVQEAIENLEKFKEQYTERPFTDKYYEIQAKLPVEIRNKRNSIYQEMAAVREAFVGGEITEEAFELLRLNQAELDDMESLYDSLGNLKQGDAYDVAKAIIDWKTAKSNTEIPQFDANGMPLLDAKGQPIVKIVPTTVYPKLSDETLNVFTRTLSSRKQKLQSAIAAAESQYKAAQNDSARQLALRLKQDAYDEYNRWASIYTRTTYSQAFYDERALITSEIQQLLGDRGDNLTELYENLFNLLKGKKDRNGEYMPNEVSDGQRQTAKELEERIEEIKGLTRSNSPLDKDSKDKLVLLVEQLQDLQSNVNSKAYEKTVEDIKASLRTQIATANPTLDSSSIERLVSQAFKQSAWYADNHIKKVRYDSQREETVLVEEPIFMWRVTRPNDESYIEEEAPSFLWFSPKVSTEFQNPNHVLGETTFKETTSGPYYNANYDSLRSNQKVLLGRMRDALNGAQSELYKKDKLGDIIPGIYKTGGELFLDFFSRNRPNPLKRWWNQQKEWLLGETRQALGDEDETFGIAEQTDAFGEPITRESRKLFVRYSRPMAAEEQSYDIMTAIASYSASAARFRTHRKYQSTILAMEELLSGRKAPASLLNKQGSSSNKVIGDLIDRQLYGKGVNNPKNVFAKVANGILHGAGRLAGAKSLGFNAISLFPNYFNGYKNNLADRRFYDLSYSDYLAAYKETMGLSLDFITGHAQTGNKPLRMQIIDFFGGTQSNYEQEFKELSNKGVFKYSKFHKFVSNLREYTEYDIAAQTTFAMLNKYRVPLTTGGEIKLKDAFHIVNGALAIKPDVVVSPQLLRKIKDEISTANYRAQGVYDSIGQPTVAKYALVRQLLFLKKWVPMHAKTEWGVGNIHYGAGVKTVGANLAMMRFLQQTFFEYGRFWEASKNLTKAEKAALAKFRFNFFAYLTLGNVISQMALSLECEDDGEADWKDYVCFLSKKIANEAEGVFTLWGMNEMLFTYVQEQANGTGFFEKLGWSVFGPFSVFRKFVDWDNGLYSTDPYYKYRPNSDKIDWDKTHPTQAGKPGLGVLAMEILGTKGAMLGLDAKSIEFQNRAFNSYTPKTYTKELRTRYLENHDGLETMKTRTEEAQAKKQYKKQLKQLQKRVSAFEAAGEDVPQEIYDEMEVLNYNYSLRVSEIQDGREPNKVFTGVKPFYMSRPGLDLEEEEIPQTVEAPSSDEFD
jgi:hypothetical protein